MIKVMTFSKRRKRKREKEEEGTFCFSPLFNLLIGLAKDGY